MKVAAALLFLLAPCVAARAAVPVPPAPTGWAWGAVSPGQGGALETRSFGVVAQGAASLPPGRYRLTVRARFGSPGASLLVVHLPAGGHDYSRDVRSPSGYPADRADPWKTLSYEFDAEAGATEGPQLSYADFAHLHDGAPGLLQVEAASLRIQPLPPAVHVSYARPAKLRFKPGEWGAVEASLTNGAGIPRTVRVRPSLTDGDDAETPGPARSFTVPAHGTVSVRLPFRAPRAQGGYEASAQIVDDAGRVLDSRGDVFADTASPFAFAIRGSWGPAWMITPPEHSLAAARADQDAHWDRFVRDNAAGIAWMRSQYVTYHEYVGWAREDATLLTETTDDPYLGGQASWITSRKLLKLTIGLLKAQGIAPVGYVNAEPFGWPGFEVFRRSPEWFSYQTPAGPPSAGFNTDSLEKYARGTNPAGGDYPFIEPSWEAVSRATGLRYIDYHIRQTVESARLYGWEAYRYDAGTPPPKYWPRIKSALAALDPPVFVGSNQGINNLGPALTPDWGVYCRGGALMMEESIDGAFSDPASPRRRWDDWRAFLRAGADLTRRSGGFYQFIDQNGNWLSTTVGYAAGGHPYSYMAYQNPYGTNERFMLRYGWLFWDPRSRLLPAGEQGRALAVSSARPLWWEGSVNERVLSAARRQVIVPLINPPTGQTVNDTSIAAQASGVRVTLTPRPGETVRAYLYAPEPVVSRRPLPLTRGPGGHVTASVPPFWAWTNVVFDCCRGLKGAR